MSTVFISHSNHDDDAARDLLTRLRSQGYQAVFLDFDPVLGIPAGRDWERELYRNLKICRAVIVLCSPQSMASRWCFAEIAQARALGKAMFPLKVASCEVDSVLSDRQIVDLVKDGASGFDRLWLGLRSAGLDPRDDFDWDHRRPPYPGMNVFQEEDAGVYFGREPEIVNVLTTLTRMRDFGDRGVALVMGASGCGKSSMVRAGVVPRLRKDLAKWLIVPPFRPGDTPLDELAKMLAATVPGSTKHSDWGELKRRLATAPDELVQIVSELAFAASQLDPAGVRDHDPDNGD